MEKAQPEKISILLVEDDSNLSMVLQDYLELMNYTVVSGVDGEEGLAKFMQHPVDLCILDVMLPKMDGFMLAKSIRKINQSVPIIFLTAKSLKQDRLQGFDHGCDDYVTKPFSTEELNLRIKAILRRCIKDFSDGRVEEQKMLPIGKFIFDVKNMLLISDFGEQTLTRKEASLLHLLLQHKNKLMTRDLAQNTIWGETDYYIGRSMDVFIARLRKYLKDDPSVNINNVHGIGFTLEEKTIDKL
ncbi:MAG: DNA-binding response regulator [Bacteroidetes bacterium HGW-Bacteroidetes-1]|jgi:DNA-binding response OmpR family regulator|nr:MAG: DNA-binding response regulator [Bacteroidetes bacterium HGW-Bacteroidetes-1]